MEVDGDAACEDDLRKGRPKTREEIAQLKARLQSNQAIAYKFYGDIALQVDLKMLYLGARPIIKAYQDTIDVQKGGQDSS